MTSAHYVQMSEPAGPQNDAPPNSGLPRVG